MDELLEWKERKKWTELKHLPFCVSRKWKPYEQQPSSPLDYSPWNSKLKQILPSAAAVNSHVLATKTRHDYTWETMKDIKSFLLISLWYFVTVVRGKSPQGMCELKTAEDKHLWNTGTPPPTPPCSHKAQDHVQFSAWKLWDSFVPNLLTTQCLAHLFLFPFLIK